LEPLGTHQDARLIAAAIAAALAASGVTRQSRLKKTPEQRKAAQEAHRGDFDYLLGDWEFTGVRRMPGASATFRGYWSAMRLHDGQVLDEFRIVGDEGESGDVTCTFRNYNAFLDRWELVGASAGTGLLDFGTAQKEGDDMLIEQSFGVGSGERSHWRIRYHDIGTDRFFSRADRSIDGGTTWVDDFQTIEVRRIGPPRTLPALAPARGR